MSSVSKGDTMVHLRSGSERASVCLGPRAGMLRPARAGTGPAAAPLLLEITFAVLYYKP